MGETIMKVLIDKYVPYLRGVVEPYAEVEFLEPEEFTPERVHDADALIIRTRTKANAALLDGSRVRLVTTATIGYDHIDTAYCEAHDIVWRNSPGCNAAAVCQYVESVIFDPWVARGSSVGQPQNHSLLLEGEKEEVTIGVVGVGHVGSLVVDMAERHGLRVLPCDPPKGIGVDMATIAREADIITFHTPLTRTGEYPSYHLCDEAFLAACKPGALIINAARGGVVDEEALLRSGHPYVLDTWEGEPKLNQAVMDGARIATYHIAGYSIQGKINASNACLAALSEVFGLPKMTIDPAEVPQPGDNAPGWLSRIDKQLREHPTEFESLRETYRLR